MRSFWDWLLDEKVVTCSMAVFFTVAMMVLIFYKAEKEYIAVPGGAVTMLVGSLIRGTTHQPQQTDSTQTVSSTTTVTPKEEVKP
jgi:hypothetical protein